jgi:hydrophobic/amphiphilic exporter-1 (mainly G- bacteria), HAE1 family
MKIVHLSLSRPVLTWIVHIALLLLGSISFSNIGVDSQPKVEIPVVNITVSVPGSNPALVEHKVLIPIEKIIKQINGVDTYDGAAYTGQANVTILFNLNTNMLETLSNLRNLMSNLTASKNWPSNAGAPSINVYDPNAKPIGYWGVQPQNNMNTKDFMLFVNDVVVPIISQINGVALVAVSGLRLPQFDIWFDQAKLAELHLSPIDVTNQLQSKLVIPNGGSIDDYQKSYAINPSNNVNTLRQLGNLFVNRPGGSSVRLADIAQVVETLPAANPKGFYDGTPIVFLTIIKSPGANILETVKNVGVAIKTLGSNHQKQVKFFLISDSSKFIAASMNNLKEDLFIGALFTIVIVFIFLGNLKTTLICALSIPVSILTTVIVMYLFGFTFNPISALALSLSTGIIIDDAIVVIENIHRHREMGKRITQAILDAMKEIGEPAVAISLAIFAVFFPVTFMSGIIGRYFYEFGITVSCAVLVSLFVAFTLTPMLNHNWFDENLHSSYPGYAWFNKQFARLEEWYVRGLTWSLKFRKTTILLGVMTLIISIFLFKMVPMNISPDVDTGDFILQAEYNPNNSIETTAKKAVQVSDWLLKVPGILHISARVSANTVKYHVDITSQATRNFTSKQLQNFVADSLQNWTTDPTEQYSANKNGKQSLPIQVVLSSNNGGILDSISASMHTYLANIPQVTNVQFDTDANNNEMQLRVHPELGIPLGIDSNSLGNLIYTLYGGGVLGSMSNGIDAFNIVAGNRPDLAATGSQLAATLLPINQQFIPLGAIADVKKNKAQSEIDHHNGLRSVTLVADYKGQDLQRIMTTIETYFNALNKDGVVYLDKEGDSKLLNEAGSSLGLTLLWSFVFAYLVLCAQFESFLVPILVLLSVPLAFSGSFLALLLARQPFSLFAMIGFILLTGIVKKNAILLLDFAEQKIRFESLAIGQALVASGTSRLRPILMTSLAMICGMLPTAFGQGLGHEQNNPLGICVIGGIFSSTLLTLFVIPALYSTVLLRRQRKNKPLVAKKNIDLWASL